MNDRREAEFTPDQPLNRRWNVTDGGFKVGPDQPLGRR